jgi:hypothetical protein
MAKHLAHGSYEISGSVDEEEGAVVGGVGRVGRGQTSGRRQGGGPARAGAVLCTGEAAADGG